MRLARLNGWLVGGALTAAALAIVHICSRKAERDNPPAGRFASVGGVRLHYVERGQGPVLVLLHGNASSSIDFLISPFASLAAERYRILVFDRPGYGYSDPLQATGGSPEQQARLIAAVLRRLGVRKAVVLGHSLGALVAIAMALEFPRLVRGVALEAGFLYPQPRVDMALLSQAAAPILGALIRHTFLPLLARIGWPFVAQHVFAPAPVPGHFWRLPPWILLRPGQIKTSAIELRRAGSFARRLASRYGTLRVPLVILTGTGDRLVEHGAHSGKLHAALPNADYRRIRGVGHMVHHSRPAAVLAAVDQLHQHKSTGTRARRPIRT